MSVTKQDLQKSLEGYRLLERMKGATHDDTIAARETYERLKKAVEDDEDKDEEDLEKSTGEDDENKKDGEDEDLEKSAKDDEEDEEDDDTEEEDMEKSMHPVAVQLRKSIAERRQIELRKGTGSDEYLRASETVNSLTKAWKGRGR